MNIRILNEFSEGGCGLAKSGATACLSLMLAASSLVLAQAASAAEEQWTFGVGTGISSLALDGEVGFATGSGGVLGDFDLDNSDTANMLQSAIGAGGFANKGRWTIHAKFATLTLEDDNKDYEADWDRTFGELAVEYAVGKLGNNAFGVIAGVNYTDHDWEFKNKETREKFKPNEDWTDFMFGVTHKLPFAKDWAWANRVDYAVGDSEGTFSASTSVNWNPYTHWVFSFGLGFRDVEYGDKSDINDSNFYYYDTDETTINLGFVYVW